MLYDQNKYINRKNSPGNLTQIMELSWKSHGILFSTVCDQYENLLDNKLEQSQGSKNRKHRNLHYYIAININD